MRSILLTPKTRLSRLEAFRQRQLQQRMMWASVWRR